MGAEATRRAGLIAALLLAATAAAQAQPSLTRFNAFEPATPAGSTSGVIQTKVAGRSFMLALVALTADRSSVRSDFTGAVRVELLDAGNDSGALDAASGCRNSWTVIRALAPNPAFGAANGGRIEVALEEPEAWRVLRVRVSSPPGSMNSVGCSTDGFAVRPAQLIDAQASAGSDSTPGLARLLANTDPTAGIVHRAGRPFSVQARAVNDRGTTTAGYRATPSLRAVACLQPAGCSAGVIAATLSAAGAVTGTATYSEAGVVSAQLEDLDFAAVDAGDSSADQRAVRSAPFAIGRFVADRYRLSAINAPQLAPGLCGAGPARQSFTYVGQEFSFATAPQVLATPVNAAGDALANARPRLAAAHASAQLTAAAAPVPLTGTPQVASVANAATSTIALDASSFRFTRNAAAPVASFVPTIDFRLSVRDTSESGATAPIDSEAPLALAALPFAGGSGRFHHGRAILRPVHGDSRRPLSLPLEVQSFNGAGWVALADAGTCLAAAPLVFAYSAARGALDAGGGVSNCASRVDATVVTAGGRAAIALARPGATPQPAAMVVTLNLLASAAGQTCDGAVPAPAATLDLPWLTVPDGSALGASPAARVSWGRARGEFISVRERFD